MRIKNVVLLVAVTIGGLGGCAAEVYTPRPVVVAPAPVAVVPAPVVVAPVPAVVEPCYYCRPYYRRW